MNKMNRYLILAGVIVLILVTFPVILKLLLFVIAIAAVVQLARWAMGANKGDVEVIRPGQSKRR